MFLLDKTNSYLSHATGYFWEGKIRNEPGDLPKCQLCTINNLREKRFRMKRFLWLLPYLGSFTAAFAQFEEPSLLEEIVIPIESAKKFYTIHSSKVINDSLLTRHNGTATDLLKRFASIHFKENGYGMVSSPSFRGTTAQQTSVLWNGIPINSNFLGQTDFNSLSFREFDEIEVISGGGSVILGSGAIGGSILLNQKIDFKAKDSHSISLGYGSLQTFQAQLKNRFVKNNWIYGWTAQYTKSENEYQWKAIQWENRNGAFENLTFSPTISYKINDQHSISYFGSIYSDERHFSLISQYQTPTKYNNFHLRNLLKWKSQWGHQKLEVDLAQWKESYKYFQNIQNEHYLDGTANTYYAKGFYQWKWNSFWNNSIQVEHKHSTGNSTENPLKNIRQNITDVSWFHSLKFHKDWKAEVGIKQEWSDVFENPFLYSAALEWKPNRWSLGISSSKNYRIPSFNDLFWEPGGNKNLKPETSFQNELKVVYQGLQWKAQANIYHNQMKDMIRWIPTASGYWMAENTNEVTINGVETEWSINQKYENWNWNWSVQYAFTHAMNEETQLQLMYVPKHKFTSQFDINYKNWELGIQAIQLGKVYSTSDEDESYALDSYLTFDAQLGYFFDSNKKWFAQVGVYNLNNRLYYSMPDRPMPNRNYTIKLTYTF